ncbi:hypothetical protein [Cobetia sp. L2A1]|uniref:hypothetical protein n=1 Tax=Cobetia sp. L2A1 TaxID=2686360 RepID=UPI00131ADED0|nr:hypothetical protein [Cobetia sp. L2A1]
MSTLSASHAARSKAAQPAAPRSRAASFWLGGRSSQGLRHGLGVGALGLMLGSTPAYANGIEDLPIRHQLNASGLMAGAGNTTQTDTADSNSVKEHGAKKNGAYDDATWLSDDSSSNASTATVSSGLAPELLTQMMMHASRQGMLQFSAMDIGNDHVQFTGWGRSGWEMELSINLADGELISEALRKASPTTDDNALDRDNMRETLNFAASDGIKSIQTVEVDADGILIKGLDHQGQPQQMSLNMPLPGGTTSLASTLSLNPGYR